MRIQLASDLHLERLQHRFPDERLISPAPGADVLVLAGDVAHGWQAIELFKDWPVPVVYVLGNHEPYEHELHSLFSQLVRLASGTPIRVLHNATAQFPGVRILGSTLWTDYRLRANLSEAQVMAHAASHLDDYSQISYEGTAFTPEHARREHEQSVRWLLRELERPFDGKTVVVTHHAPHLLSVHPRYAGDPLNAAFASDLTPLIRRADLWLHGHVHDSVHYRLGRCRVMANPRGYARNASVAATPAALVFENKDFASAFLVKI